MFAEFLHGPFRAVEAAMKQHAKKWATQYKKSASFPPCHEIAATAGTIVLTHDISDLNRNTPNWRVYFVRALGSEIAQTLQWQDYKNVASAFEAHMLGTAWGALDYAVSHVAPNALENVTRRLEALAQFWRPLESLLYIDRVWNEPVSLQDLITHHYAILFAQWNPSGKCAGPDDLRKAVATMRRATKEDVDTSAKMALLQLAQGDDRVRNRATLLARDRLETLWSEALTDEERSDVGGLHPGALRRALYVLDKAADLEK
jgi:hypothetical protein